MLVSNIRCRLVLWLTYCNDRILLMDREVWQQLLSLESRDIIQQWFKKIHHRELNVRRTKEINAAAKQAREYFRNASNSNYSVKPLLTFYGVASLSRALLLLLKRDGGEEGMAGGHGLTTVDWNETLSGDPSLALGSLAALKVQTCTGLFSDFMIETKNRTSMHIRSSVVDWRLNYDVPDKGKQILLSDLFARIPDLSKDYSNITSDIKYAAVNEISFTRESGFKAKVSNINFENFKAAYENSGYKIDTQGDWSTITCDVSVFKNNTPLFVHSYIHKMFESIPILHIAERFPGDFAYSQLGITYLCAYYLGMLVRYYPTHWMSLLQGDKGDALWPTINRAQQFVETSYPELVIEMIYDILSESESLRADSEQQ